MAPFPDAAYPPPRVVEDGKVTIRMDYEEAVYLYELLRGDVCKTEMVSPERRERAAQWASTIRDATDRYERGGD